MSKYCHKAKKAFLAQRPAHGTLLALHQFAVADAKACGGCQMTKAFCCTSSHSSDTAGREVLIPTKRPVDSYRDPGAITNVSCRKHRKMYAAVNTCSHNAHSVGSINSGNISGINSRSATADQSSMFSICSP